MKQNHKITILIILPILISSCSLTGGKRLPNPVEIQTAPIEIEIYHPPLPKAIQLERPDWYVVSDQNVDEFMEKLVKIQGIEEEVPTFFALSPQGYEKMSGNLQEMRRYILEQKEIIVYYKDVTTPDRPYEGAEDDSNGRPSVGIFPRENDENN